MKIYIYQIYFPTSNKYYIGQTCNFQRRIKEHLRSGHLVCNALYKYDDWQISILHTCKSRDEANRIEIEEIRNFNCINPNGYNLTAGGEGASHCQQTKEKIRSSRQGMQASDKTKEKMKLAHLGNNNSFYGRHHSKESIQKIREVKLGKSLEELGHKLDCNCSVCKAKRGETSGKNNPMFGRKRLDVAKRNKNPNVAEQIKRLKNKIAKLKSE